MIFEIHDTTLSPEIIISHSSKADWQEGKEIISPSPLSVDLNILRAKHYANNLRPQLHNLLHISFPLSTPHTPTPNADARVHHPLVYGLLFEKSPEL